MDKITNVDDDDCLSPWELTKHRYLPASLTPLSLPSQMQYHHEPCHVLTSYICGHGDVMSSKFGI